MLGLTLETKPKIAIVEDMEAVREMLAAKFKREGFQVYTAKDGEEGYECIKKHHPDLVVSDIFMPGLDGFHMMRKVRQDARVGMVPVVFLSIMSEQEHREQIWGIGNVAAYIWKDECSLEEVVRRVKIILNR